MTLDLTTFGSTVYDVTGFELLEADGGGIRDIHVAVVATESAAREWVSRSKSYRRYRPYNETFVVHASIESLDALDLDNRKKAALAKLSAEDRKILGL